jgi:hypothetical protein
MNNPLVNTENVNSVHSNNNNNNNNSIENNNVAIEKVFNRNNNDKSKRILLCGLENSGKSTFLKQVFDFFKKSQCGVHMEKASVLTCFPFLCGNSEESIQKVKSLYFKNIKKMLFYLLPYFKESHEDIILSILNEPEMNENVNSNISKIWKIHPIKTAIERLELVKVPGNINFSSLYFEDLERYIKPKNDNINKY